MTIDNKNILWLDLFETLTYNKKLKLLDIAGRNNDIRKVFLNNQSIRELLSTEEFNKMAVCLDESFLNRKLKDYVTNNIKTITFYDEEYPYLLKEIDSPPLCLYCKGNTQLLNTVCIGVVGSRRPSEYGLVVTKQFVKELAEADVTIVSGMAAGVDTIAHRTTLENRGNTIAVLAGGFNHVYPASNFSLFKELSENNLIISEYNPEVKPQTYYFPIRNRIIAGLSKGVLVTEAGEKSGSLHTINYAIDFNREIFAVPGRINSEMSKGCNNIIKEYKDAFVTAPDDILTCFNIKKQENEKKLGVQLDFNVQLVLDYINTEKKTFQEILDNTKLSTKELNAILLELELSGLVTKLANNSYIMS